MKVVITGSSKGIGLAFAKEFLKFGDEVVITSRSKDKVEAVLKEIKTLKSEAKIYGTTCDVTKIEDIKSLVEFSSSKLGSIDIWINNAGSNAYIYENLVETPENLIKQIIDTNILGTLYSCKEIIKYMHEQGHGHIFNMAGYGSNGRATPKLAAYGASKSAMPQIVKTLSKEINNEKIGIHLISPGMVMTDLLTKSANEESKRIFNILAELPETVASKLVPKIRKTKGSGKSINFLSSTAIMLRFLTAGRRKNRFYDNEGNLVI